MQRATLGLVSGRVQGIFYRASFQHEARSRGLTGWVRNLPNGCVEFLVQGDADAVQEVLDWAREGPAYARVGDVDARETSYDRDLRSFDIRS